MTKDANYTKTIPSIGQLLNNIVCCENIQLSMDLVIFTDICKIHLLQGDPEKRDPIKMSILLRNEL